MQRGKFDHYELALGQVGRATVTAINPYQLPVFRTESEVTSDVV